MARVRGRRRTTQHHSRSAAFCTVAWSRRCRAALLVGTALQASAALVLAMPASAQPAPNAHPTGGAVAAGAATISQTQNNTTITQSTERAALNWQSFDVGNNQTVTFAQPDANASTLNRVIGPNPSQIAGHINANGQVALVNQSGVIFYQGAQVNTAGLIATAPGITNENFMAGKLVFDQAAHPNAAVINHGTITVQQAGLAALVAPQVANSGVITARLGHVVLAGAKTATLDLYGDGLLAIDVTGQVTQAPMGPDGQKVAALVTNSGIIRADGGTVQLTARAADGVVQTLMRAGGTIAADTVGNRTGTVVLTGIGGSITLTGVASAAGAAPGTHGGAIVANASDTVTVANGARLDASGAGGGGIVAVGTTLKRAKSGPGTTARLTAKRVVIQPGATIAANATSAGDGGRVTVLSTDSTQMAGTIAATGGAHGGNGGFVEVSGGTLTLTGPIDTSAPIGTFGTILLDPTNLAIVASTAITGSSVDGEFSGGTLASSAPDGSPLPSTVSASTIDTLGNSGSVVVQASGTIEVQTTVAVTHGLTIQAGGNLTVDAGAPITAGGDLLLQAGTATAGSTLAINDKVSSTGGSTSLLAGLGGTLNLGAGGMVAAAGQRVTLQMDTLITAAGATVSAPTGMIELAPASAIAVTLGGAGGLSLSQAQLAAMQAATLRIGSATINNAPTITASSISIAGPISLSGIATTLDLQANGAISETGTGALTNAGTLDINGGAVTLGGGNIIGTLGSVTATSITLDDGTDLAMSGTVNGGSSVTIVDTGTLSVPGTVSAAAVNLFGLTMHITGEVTAGPTGTVTLTAYTGGINEVGGTIIAGTLTGTSVGPVSLGINSANSITTLGNFSVTSGSGSGSFALTDTAPLTVVGTISAPGSIYLEDASAAGMAIAAAGRVGAGAAVSFQADAFVNAGTVTGTLFELAPNTSGGSVTLGASLSGLSLPSLAGIGPTEVRIGAVTLPGTATPTTTAGTVSVAGNFGGSGVNLELDTTGQVNEAIGAVLTAGTLSGSAAGGVFLASTGNAIGTVANLAAGTNDIVLVNGTNLTLAGTQSGANLFFEVAASDDTLALGAPGALVVPATLTAATGGRISLVADAITQQAGSAINAPSGTVELAPFSAINTSLLGGSGLAIGAPLLSILHTSTLVLGGFTDMPHDATTPAASASSISIDGAANLTGIATSLDLLATGAISEPGGPLTVGTLGGSGGVWTLTTATNGIGTLGTLTASNLSLVDGSNLLIAGTLTAPAITLQAPTSQISLGNGATIVTSGVGHSSGIPVPSQEPQNGALGAFVQSVGFAQIGSSTIAGSGGGSATLQIGLLGGDAQFDPPLGLLGPTTWLILNLGSGHATGNVLVGALNVTYSTPGAAALLGTIAGVTGGPAAGLGVIQPGVNGNYTFNGCVIETVCVVPQPTPIVPTPIVPTLIVPPPNTVTVGLTPFLPGTPLPLPILPDLVLVALPVLPPAAHQLTDPDVVPPNIAYLDY